MKNLLAEDVMNESWIFETDQHAWNLLCFASCCAHRPWADVPLLRRSPLREPKKTKKTKNTVKKKLTLKGHKSFGSDALENLTSCAASTSILWLLIFFWTRATDFTAKKGLLNLLLNNTFRKYPHLKNNINHSKNEAKNVRISYIYEITWLELLKLTSRKLRSFE